MEKKVEEKKKNEKKTASAESKKTVKKKVTHRAKKPVEKKSVLPVEESFGTRFRRFVASYRFLYTAFGVLLVLVVLLGIMVYVKGEEAKEKNSNIVFSILDENTRNSLSVDLASLVGKEYTLKVTNYRKNKINPNGAQYRLILTNDSDASIEVVKDDEAENLMTDSKKSVIEGEKFSKTEKENVIYTIRVKDSDKVKKGDSLEIEIQS